MVFTNASKNNNDQLETEVVDDSKSLTLKIDEQKGMKQVDATEVMLMVGSPTADKDVIPLQSPSVISPSNVSDDINDTSLSNLSTSDIPCIDSSSGGIKESNHIILDIENAPFDEILNNGGSDTTKSHPDVESSIFDADNVKEGEPDVVVAGESKNKKSVEEYLATVDSASTTTLSNDTTDKPTEEEKVIDTPIGKMKSVDGHKRANGLAPSELDPLESAPKKHSPDKDDAALDSNQEAASN